MMIGEGVKSMLAKPIQLADQVAKLAEDVESFRAECAELKVKAEKLAGLLRQAARADLYERPAVRILGDTAQVLTKVLSLVDKCRNHGLVHRLFTIIPAASFPRMSTNLDNSMANVSWLLRISSIESNDGDLHGLPNIAQGEPILFLIWEHIARLQAGSPDAREESAFYLASLARDNDHFANRIIEEDGVGPLLRLLKEGRDEGQESAAGAIRYLGRHAESVDKLVRAGMCSVFAKVLKDGSMRVQALVAQAVAELVDRHPNCQELFEQSNVARLLVGHLAFETVQEHIKYAVGQSKGMSLHSAVLAHTKSMRAANNTATAEKPNKNRNPNDMLSVVQSATRQHHAPSSKGRELESEETKAELKAMAAYALWKLAKGSISICKSMTESRALLCFAVLLEKGVGDVRYYSAMALMEIARVAEHNIALRQSAFKPSSPTAKAVVDQLLYIVRNGAYDNLLLPCITALGSLSRTFQASETRIIRPLVLLLEATETEMEMEVTKEAVVALTKFVYTENHLHLNHSKAIIEAGGATPLVQLVYLHGQVQMEALVLLCYIALHVPDSEELQQAGVLGVLLWASKQEQLGQDPRLEALLSEARARIELFQSIASR
ncbi:uncharacterized protein [Typha angustifolia]|uniref:uncharacterized protein n=1 Tax=Typha angustifolia TaxID=59011 RepID=UPI003C2DB4DE